MRRQFRSRTSYKTVFRWIDVLGSRCKDTIQVARELRPKWKMRLGLDTKVIKVHGYEWLLVLAVDLGTQDVVHAALVKHEDYPTLRTFLEEIRDEIGYYPDELVIDLWPAWIEACRDVFPDVPLQGCVVHIMRIIDRTMPRLKRSKSQSKLRGMVRAILFAANKKGAESAFKDLMLRRGEFRDKKSRQVMKTIRENFQLIVAHFIVENSFRDNNITESVIDKIEMKLKMIRGYKKRASAKNSLKLIVMHYRFNQFSSCRVKVNNGKSPLMLAGIDTTKMDWTDYSQRR